LEVEAMDIYSVKDGKLNHIEEVDFKLEKDIQKICDDNLQDLFDLEVVKSQFTIQGFRIDTLAFDPKSKAFVIIEYKKNENFSVVDQGYAYLSLVLNNKAECVLVYNENRKKPIKKDDIDWTQTRVMFIAPSFTPYQVQSINFKDLPIELWEIKRYANDTISIEQIEPLSASESIKTISPKSKAIEKVTKEIKVYTEDDHLSGIPEDIKELYDKFKNLVLSIGNDIKIKPRKQYIAFVSKTNFTDVEIHKKELKVYFNLKKGELDDPKGLTKDVSQIGHWGNGDYEVKMSNDENLDYIVSLVKQSYKKNSA
jgi:predicted transport protein